MSIVILISAALVFAMMATAGQFKSHIACHLDSLQDLPEIDGKLCPYCGSVPKVGEDGLPICVCDEFLQVSGLSECEEHGLIYDGRTCPKCSGTNRWHD